jgi:hypothetical protein
LYSKFRWICRYSRVCIGIFFWLMEKSLLIKSNMKLPTFPFILILASFAFCSAALRVSVKDESNCFLTSRKTLITSHSFSLCLIFHSIFSKLVLFSAKAENRNDVVSSSHEGGYVSDVMKELNFHENVRSSVWMIYQLIVMEG